VHHARTASPRGQDEIQDEDGMEGNVAILRKASIHGLVGIGLVNQWHSEGEYCPRHLSVQKVTNTMFSVLIFAEGRHC
jgi:hypothetical protein